MRTAAENWNSRGWDAGAHFLAALSILRVEELIRRSDDKALRPHGLTHSRHEALALLYFSRSGALPMGKLGERLLVHPTSVTSTVDALERLGLAERVPHPSDRRATLAQITSKGRTAIETSCQAMAAAQSGLHPLTDNQARHLYVTLKKVRVDAGDFQNFAEPPHEGDQATTAGNDARDPVLVAQANWHRAGWEASGHFLASLSILRTTELIRRSNDNALRPHRLTHSRHEALALLYFSRSGALPMGKLGERLLVHPTSVTSTVDTLERLGLAERVPHPSDRRATLAQITSRGRTAIETSCRAMVIERFGLHALSDNQAKQLFTILSAVRSAAGDIR